MQVVLLALSLVAYASATVQVDNVVGYHERVAIPLARKIKIAEDAIQAVENRHSRIVGGNIARPNAHPYLGGLLLNYLNNPNVGVCGSVLVTRNRLVTAAHCWFDGRIQAIRVVVVLGSHLLFSGGDRIPTSNVITYPGWNPETLQNNFAVILIPKPVLLTSNIQPIALAINPDETFAGEWAVASGYGFTSDNKTSLSIFTVVSEVTLQVITVEQCRSVFGDVAQPNTVCTSGEGGVGTCRGDAGGPLVVTRNGEPLLIGVGTFGATAGCERGFPSGFSRVTSFMPFLAKYL